MTRILVSLIFAFFLSAVAAFAQPIAFITKNVGHILNGVAVSPDGSSV